jgi:hypothetical protein
MDNQALARREASRDALDRAPRVVWDRRAGCHKSGLSGSGRGGWCPLQKGLAAYFINKVQPFLGEKIGESCHFPPPAVSARLTQLSAA